MMGFILSHRARSLDTFGNLLATASYTNAGTSASMAMSSAVTVKAGDLVVVVVGEQIGAPSSTGVSDDLSNTWNGLTAGGGGNVGGRLWWSIITNAGSMTVTVTGGTSSADDSANTLCVYEGPFAASPVDVESSAVYNASAAGPWSTPATGTLAQAAELIIAWFTGQGGFGDIQPSAPFTLSKKVSNNIVNAVASLVVNSTDSVTATFTGGTAAATKQIVTFKKA